MEAEIDYWAVAEALRARGRNAWVEGGGAAAPFLCVGIAGGRSTTWDGDADAWFASFVEADGDQGADEGLEIGSIGAASSPDEVADAICEAVQDL
jgi:hypothetical protein